MDALVATLSATRAALAGLASAVLLSGESKAAADPVEPVRSAFHFQLMSQEDSSAIVSRCGAILLRRDVAITAAHCVFYVPESASVICRSMSGDEPIRLGQILRHPTHDVALIQVQDAHRCALWTDGIEIGPVRGGPYLVSVTQPEEIAKRSVPAWRTSWRSPDGVEPEGDVLFVTLGQNCPRRGDSGTGLFSRRDGATLIHGILIGSTPGCPGRSTFVRLAPLRAWVERHAGRLTEENGE